MLPLQARRARWLLCPANLAPLAHPRTAVVIHDAAPLRDPSWYSRRLRPRPAGAAAPRSPRRAKLVITVSEFSRAELRELLGVDAHVVPGGVDERFTPRRGPRAGAARAHALDRPYVLTVASRTTRKNLGVLTPVADALAADGIEIVAAGGDRPQFRAPARRRPSAPLGHVDDDLLPGLYAGARAFVLPSLYEGFGLTCLEAMACGTPVVAADRAALPETCGDAALLVDPTDPQADHRRDPRRGDRRRATSCDGGLRAPRRSRGSAPRARSTRCCHAAEKTRDAVVVDALARPPGGHQDVEVAEDLRQRQVGLGHRDVAAPQRQRDLVRGVRPRVEQRLDLLAAAILARRGAGRSARGGRGSPRRGRRARSTPPSRAWPAATRGRSSASWAGRPGRRRPSAAR